MTRDLISYLTLTDEQRSQVDLIDYVRFDSIDAPLFFVDPDGNISALDTISEKHPRYLAGTHHLFCYSCRTAFEATTRDVDPHPDDGCARIIVLEFQDFAQAKAYASRKTLREQFDDDKN